MKNKDKNDHLLRSKLNAFEPEPHDLTFDSLNRSYKTLRLKTLLKKLMFFSASAVILVPAAYFIYTSMMSSEKLPTKTTAKADLQTEQPVPESRELIDPHKQHNKVKDLQSSTDHETHSSNETPSSYNTIVQDAITATEIPAGKKYGKREILPSKPAASANTASAAFDNKTPTQKNTVLLSIEIQTTTRKALQPQKKLVAPVKQKPLAAAKLPAGTNSTEKPSIKPSPLKKDKGLNNRVGDSVLSAETIQRTATGIKRKSKHNKAVPSSAKDQQASKTNTFAKDKPVQDTASDTTIKQESLRPTMALDEPPVDSVISTQVTGIDTAATNVDTIIPKSAAPEIAMKKDTAGSEAGTAYSFKQDSATKRPWHFSISSEAVLNRFTIRQNLPDTLSVNKIKDIKGAKTNQVGAAMLFGGYYKHIGLTTGFNYMSFEIQNKTAQGSFSMQKSVIDRIVQRDSVIGVDTNSTPIYVTRIDTFYKTIAGPQSVIVNGDTVEAGDYKSTVRMLTIPLHVSYRFSLFKARLSLEPSAGVQISIPLKSQQLVATKPGEFIYSKNKDALRKTVFFYDFALKLGYRISRNGYIYIRQGYFFSNKSLNPDSYSFQTYLNNSYTSIGISIMLR